MKKWFLSVVFILITLPSIVAQTNGSNTSPTPSPVSIDLIQDSVFQAYLSAMGKLGSVFKDYFASKTAFDTSLTGWIGSNNFWALVPIDSTLSNNDQSLPVSNSLNLQVQAAQNANFSAGVSPENFLSMNDLVQLLMIGAIYPVADESNATNNIIAYSSLSDLAAKKCSTDWEKRFSTDDYSALCEDSNYSDAVSKVWAEISKNINDINFYRRVIYYYTQVKNCSDSISSLENATTSSSSTPSMGGQTMPDTSSVTSGNSGIPYVQCYFSSTDELAKNISSDLSSACSGLSSQLNSYCSSLQKDFNDYAQDAATALTGITYSATTDNGVSAAYGPVVNNMKSTLQQTLKNTQQIVYSDIFNSNTLISSMPLMESIYPSMDNLIMPTQYGVQTCDPTKADQDTSFGYYNASDAAQPIDYAYYYIAGLDQASVPGLAVSQTVSLADMSDNTSNVTPVYIHGGRYIYCDNTTTSTTTGSDIYSDLCQDESDNVYTTDLTTKRTTLADTISSSRESLATSARNYLAQRSAAFSNLWAMYNKRSLIGNVSQCSPAQIAEYHATWRYTRGAQNKPSWIETVSNSEDLTQMDLMREAVLLLQDINYQLHALNKTSERSMSIDTIVALNQLSASALQQGSTATMDSVQQFDTGHSSATSSASSSSSSSSMPQ